MRILFRLAWLFSVTCYIFNADAWLASQKFKFIVVLIVKYICFKIDASLIACCNYLNYYSCDDEVQMCSFIYYIHINYTIYNRVAYKAFNS